MGICVSCRRRDRKAPQKRAPGAGAAQVPCKGAAAAELLPRREPAMANSISNIKMTNPIKGIVSKRRKRYIKDGFNLDLAYITDRLIAMGFPAEKLEGVYRNHIDEVYRFLEQMHKDHYKLYNLCSERSYDTNKFHQRVERYAFDDHTPPNIELIQDFCVNVHRWLTADPKNVAAVHCKAGKGRTGTMVCCYLLYSGQKATADEALKFYGTKRTHDEKGVTIPSQRRYVQYYASLVRSRLSYTATKVHIRELVMSPPPMLNGAQCSLELAAVQAAPKREAPSGCQEVRKHDGHIRIILTQCTPLQGDVRVDVYNKPKMMMRKEKLFHFWFNTFFVTNCVGATKIQPPPDSMNLETYKITLNKWELDDAHKDKQHKLYSENFQVELIVQKQPETSTFSGQCARGTSPPSSVSSSPSPPSSDGEPDGNWDSGEHQHHQYPANNVTRSCHENRVSRGMPCDVTGSSDRKFKSRKGTAACDVSGESEHFCCKNNINIPCNVTSFSDKNCATSNGKNCAKNWGCNIGLIDVFCDFCKGDSEHYCCKNTINIPCDATRLSDQTCVASTKNCVTLKKNCASSQVILEGLSVDVSCASNKYACTCDKNISTNSKSATKNSCTCDNLRKFSHHSDMTKLCSCLFDASQSASKPRTRPNHCEHALHNKTTVCICELPTHDKNFSKHTSCDRKLAFDDTSNEMKVPYTRLDHFEDSQQYKVDVTSKTHFNYDKSPLDSASVDSQLSDRTDSSIANSQMSDFCHGAKCKYSNDYCQLSKNSESSSSRLSSDCCHRSMSIQLSSEAENSASSNHKTCKPLDTQNIEIRSKNSIESCKDLDSNVEVFSKSCYEVGSRCLNRNAVSLDGYSNVCELTDDSAFKLWHNESNNCLSTQACSKEIDDELGSAGNFTRSTNSSTKETRSLLGKDKKKQKKRDDSNASGKIPKVSSDHTISDDSKKKYTLFNRKDEDGVSKPRLSLGDMRASWREFSGKWSDNRKKKDRDN